MDRKKELINKAMNERKKVDGQMERKEKKRKRKEQKETERAELQCDLCVR